MIGGTGAMFCLYLAYKELFGKQQPQNIASRVFETLRIHDDIVGVTGKDKPSCIFFRSDYSTSWEFNACTIGEALGQPDVHQNRTDQSFMKFR